MLRTLLFLLPVLAAASETSIDFENAVVLLENAKANRFEQLVEKGVVFKLAHEPRKSKAKGLLGYFTHIATGRKALVGAMALESIPVRATFPTPVASVTVAFWGSTATPAILEAFDEQGNAVARTELPSTPTRKSPADPVPVFELKVAAPRIAYIEWSGPRPGEFLAADQVRFTPNSGSGK